MALKYDRVMPMHKIPRDDRRSLILDGHPCQIQLLDGKSHSSDQLQQAQAELFDILQQREREFGYSPAIHVVYPDRTEAFLTDPLAYIQGKIADIKLMQGRDVTSVVILTTYGDRLLTPLCTAGYQADKIFMPAGPEHTYRFATSERAEATAQQPCCLYLEAVNEQDAKIRPSFVLRLTDEAGALRGGLCGSVADVDGERFAYIATVVVDASAPASAGSRIAELALDYLGREGVKSVHLGTQTAVGFYQKMGFTIIHSIVKHLRYRVARDGSQVWNDLVIMEKVFSGR